MRSKRKACKSCGKVHPKVCMVGKRCYLCVIQSWPPRSIKQIWDYNNAVCIRIRLTTPIDTQDKAMALLRSCGGLEKLETVQKVIAGEVVPHQPGNTFYQRVMESLR